MSFRRTIANVATKKSAFPENAKVFQKMRNPLTVFPPMNNGSFPDHVITGAVHYGVILGLQIFTWALLT